MKCQNPFSRDRQLLQKYAFNYYYYYLRYYMPGFCNPQPLQTSACIWWQNHKKSAIHPHIKLQKVIANSWILKGLILTRQFKYQFITLEALV